MSETGLYALTKIIAGGVSAIMTGPLGGTDLPDVDVRQALRGDISGYAVSVSDENQVPMGNLDITNGLSPALRDLPEHFIQALLATEDARFGIHPGVDPIAVLSATIDSLMGDVRGGSTITQQVVKNAITGSDQTLSRKIREAILSIRVQEAFTPQDILQAYLANAWFGRGQTGAASASIAWFGKPWAEIELHEAAFLVGILKGPGYYDPIRYPDRALERRNLVLRAMASRDFISEVDLVVAISLPLGVIDNAASSDIFNGVPHWISSAIDTDLARYGMMNRSDISGGDIDISTTIMPEWQKIAQDALHAGVMKIGQPGPAHKVSVDAVHYGDPLSDPRVSDIRNAAARGLATTTTAGRAIIFEVDGSEAKALIDRGFGTLEWAIFPFNREDLGFTPSTGDVISYRRSDDVLVLQGSPQVQGAVVIMNPNTGAVLASVGGTDEELFPFDRTQAKRQPGSAIKPFLWTRAIGEGMRYNDLIEDKERDYYPGTGETWRPRNYNRSQSGLIPLYAGLEQSSNLVAANLIDRLGVEAMAEITELAGIYEWGGMRRHMSSALGASETALTRLTAGYASLANGGLTVNPHHISRISRDGKIIWTPRLDNNFAIATQDTSSDINAMLAGVIQRGTASRAFSGFNMPLAGKTGTTQDYKDAWFISYTPGVVVGVWIGRDDSTTIPGKPTGSESAAPIARIIYQAAIDQGLLEADGRRPGQSIDIPWPPQLLSPNRNSSAQQRTGPDAFKRPVETPARQPTPYLEQNTNPNTSVFRIAPSETTRPTEPVRSPDAGLSMSNW